VYAKPTRQPLSAEEATGAVDRDDEMAGVDRKRLTIDKTFSQASLQHGLEHAS